MGQCSNQVSHPARVTGIILKGTQPTRTVTQINIQVLIKTKDQFLLLYETWDSLDRKKHFPLSVFIERGQTSSKDGGIGRYSLPPRTTKRRTTNFKKITRTARKLNCMEVQQPRS